MNPRRLFHSTAVIVGYHIGKDKAFTGPGRCQIEQEPFLEGTKPASRPENDAEISQTAPFLITEQPLFAAVLRKNAVVDTA